MIPSWWQAWNGNGVSNIIMIGRWLIELIRRAAAAPSGGRALAGFFEQAHFACANLNFFDMAQNGETWLIRKVARELSPRYVADIGANHGDWLRCAAQAMPCAKMVMCEPQPLLAERLQARDASDRITVKQVAMGSSAGTLNLFCYKGRDTLASNVDWHKNHPSEQVAVPLMTGADLVESLGWPGVDFIKIDVEGMEHAVLVGFGELLRTGRIGVIQFEFGAFAVQQHILMRDFCDLLGTQYRIGRLMPTRVDFRDYDHRWESSEMSNFVACRVDLVEQLSS
jgi:FkbM family methyltransferase